MAEEFIGPENGSGSEASISFCYQIEIDLTRVDIANVEFEYTETGSQYPTLVSAQNWPQLYSDGIATLSVCSATQPLILISGQILFDPAEFGIILSGGVNECLNHNECSFGSVPVDCELSGWGYGETQDSWVEGQFSPCTLIQGSYQQFQTRYVITPAQNGGSCDGETIQYQNCEPPQSGTVAVLGTPTFTQVTSNSLTASVQVLDTGGSDITRVNFSIFQGGSLITTLVLNSFGLGIFVEFTGLTPNTQYTVVATARNSTGDGTSPVGTVSTLAAGSISTPTISGITDTGANTTSTFTNTGGSVYSIYGVVYKIGNSDNLTIGAPGVGRIESGGLSPDSPTQLISQLNGLNQSTQYYVRSYVQGEDIIYSSAANFTTAGPTQGVNLAQLGITAVALDNSAGQSASYQFITTPTVNLNRNYISTIIPSQIDLSPGVYRITTNFQQVNQSSLRWSVQVKTGPSQINWKTVDAVDLNTNLDSIGPISGWTYYQYEPELTYVDFRPSVPGYYNFMLSGTFSDGTGFTLNREVVIGTPTSDLELVYQELRQGNLSTIQAVTQPVYQEWIPEFPADSMYGLTISQSGSTVNPSLNINNVNRSFTAIWGNSTDNERITPTLTVTLTSPFKNSLLTNTFQKGFPLTILPAIPSITFSNPSIFSSTLTSGTNITISVSTQYAKSYTISSSLGTGLVNSPVTYSAVPAGTYTVTATATNDTEPNLQSASVTGTLTVAAAAAVISQLPQQTSGRNKFVDINTLPFVNLNGSAFSGLAIVNQPSHGVVTRTGYTIRYIPTLDYTGTDLFSFRVNSTGGAQSNIINVAVLVSAPSFIVGSGNSTITINSTEIGLTRDIIVPIVNNGLTGLTINSISIEQSGEDFKLMIPSGGSQVSVAAIENIEIQPDSTYNTTIRVEPTAVGVRSAKLKINHN